MDGPTWLTAFLDLPAGEHDAAVDFWRAVTGYAVSAPRGEHDEFATLVPPAGDAFLRVQRVRSGDPGVHVDVHRADQIFEPHRSPGGLPYCLVDGSESVRPAAATWPDGNRSVVDQVCVDIPPEVWDQECRFWADLTGWELVDVGRSEFRRLRTPADQALQILLQR
ncbi:MAG: VOC family protein, partial [Propionibacteriales bacterium]|nr:VOC family protein [Propionibacteriales bacterium]